MQQNQQPPFGWRTQYALMMPLYHATSRGFQVWVEREHLARSMITIIHSLGGTNTEHDFVLPAHLTNQPIFKRTTNHPMTNQ